MLTSFLALPGLAAAQSMAPDVGHPLQSAEASIAAHRYAAALTEINRAAAQPGLTPYDQAVISQLRGAAEAGQGNYTAAAGDYIALLNNPGTQASEHALLAGAITSYYYQAADYSDAASWARRYESYGGKDKRVSNLLAESEYQSGAYAQAEADLWAEQKSGAPFTTEDWQLLATSALDAHDQPGYAAAIDGLLRAAPTPATWQIAISQVAAAPDFPDSLTLDLYRLRFATGTLTNPDDYEDYAERAILAGDKAEAKQELTAGFAANVLTPQTDAGHAGRLLTLVNQPGGVQATPPATPLDTAIADINAGKTNAALAILEGLPGNQLAGLWAIYARDKAAGKV